jgi:hypothetical protein
VHPSGCTALLANLIRPGAHPLTVKEDLSERVGAKSASWKHVGVDLLVAAQPLQATSYKLQATSYKLQATSYKLQATSYKLQATSYKLQATSYKHCPNIG